MEVSFEDGNKVQRSALFWDITQHIVVIPYQHFRTIYRSHLQGSRIQEGCPKISVSKYHYTLCNIPEKCRSHLLHSRSLRSCNKEHIENILLYAIFNVLISMDSGEENCSPFVFNIWVYCHSLTYIRVVFHRTLCKLNFKQVEFYVSQNFPKLNFICEQKKLQKVHFKMYNKKTKTSASTKENIIYLFPSGCKIHFHDFFKFSPAGKNLHKVNFT
jgi:hypothetical protein